MALYTIKDYNDYCDFDITKNGDGYKIIVTVYEKPIKGNGTFQTTDPNMKGYESIDECIEKNIEWFKTRFNINEVMKIYK